MPELIRACLETGDKAAWEEFIRRVHPVVASSALRTARRFRTTSPGLVEDLVQETFIRICANQCRVLREAHLENPEGIFSLVKTIAIHATYDHFRTGLAGKRGGGQPELPLDTFAESGIAGSEGLPSIERRILIREIDDYLAAEVKRPADRWIFWLRYRHGLTAEEIAAVPGIGLRPDGVESLIRRLTDRVRGWLVDGREKSGNSRESSKETGPQLRYRRGEP